MKIENQMEAVRIWEESLTIPTYQPAAPEKNPMFFEKRQNQGASGRVYPYPMTEGISPEKVDQDYLAVYIENEYIQLIILPELGGRIFVGQDKTNGYDFFYRQHVVKPALIGLFGSWMSGGVEFNWPLHHRPSTFMAVDYLIEEEPDGSKTVWLGEHEAFDRNKGMVGICLHPHSNVVEAKVRLYNRTPLAQTFLWWANVGVRVDEHYQIIFPPDVYCVNDHGKRAMASWPIAKGPYGVYHGYDFGKGTDISWYKNFTPSGSCFVNKSNMDFFAGYDHGKDAGVVYVGNHHISPGKKFFTWGTQDFAKAWEHNLTDEDGPYIELMAGVYTDNQPDFSWIQPHEHKTFSQYWYPVRQMGNVKNANLDVAVNLEVKDGKALIEVCGTRAYQGVSVALLGEFEILFQQVIDLDPARPFRVEVSCAEARPTLMVVDADGAELIEYQPVVLGDTTLPEALTEPPVPTKVETVEELYTIGLHLFQYRHPTREPEKFWLEGLRRDAGDIRCNNAMGLLEFRRGNLPKAEEHFRTAIQRLIRWNLNPYDGEPYYNLGLVLRYQGRLDEAYDAFYRGIWNYAWQTAGYYEIASIDCIRGDYDLALEHLDRSLLTNQANFEARTLKAAILRRMGKGKAARKLLKRNLKEDPLDFWSRFERILLMEERGKDSSARREELVALMRGQAGTYMDVTFNYLHAGLEEEAYELLMIAPDDSPMIGYTRAFVALQLDDPVTAEDWLQQAEACSPDYCFPNQLVEMLLLEKILAAFPESPKAHYYLGNLLYDKKQYTEAIAHWEASQALDHTFGMVWRNLGVAYFNVERDPQKALAQYARAIELDPDNARTFFEYDRVQRRMNRAPRERMVDFQAHAALLDRRDDLYIEHLKLLNLLGEPEQALELALSHRFLPWEGGEGGVSRQYEASRMLIARKLLETGDAEGALAQLETALVYPENLGEGKTNRAQDQRVRYQLGQTLLAMDRTDEAEAAFRALLERECIFGDGFYYQGLALRALGDEAGAKAKFESLLADAEALKAKEVIPDFTRSFSTLFYWPEDAQTEQQVIAHYLIGLARLGLGDEDAARLAFEAVLALDANHFETLMVLMK
ncbi:MAG: DUF5107 domain-containing protein [Anaerolineaceae bacterium]|nr:DUF5107 domain-containing protein [Anaerolineaceae bacterium]